MIIECPSCRLRYDVSHRAPGTRARCRCGASFAVPEPGAGEDGSQVRCAGCGARNDPQARQCGWCGAAMANASCPSCLTLNPAHYRHCSQCGTDLAAPARALDEEALSEPLTCPRCELALEARLLADTLVDQCGGCGGVFLDHEVLHALLADNGRRASLRERLLSLPAPAALANPREVVYLRCPECATFMHRRNPAHRSGIIVDVCAAHGVWFDDRELAILMQLAGAGTSLNIGPRPNPPADALRPGGTGSGRTPTGAAGRDWRAGLGDALETDVNIGDLGDVLRVIGRLF